jgi:hypothetical protein
MGLSAIACACNDKLDIKQDYAFDLKTLPVQKTIAVNETAEIRCQLVTEGDYSGAGYFIRYFQSDGAGILMDDEGTLFTPNDLYPLTKKTFRLYYTSLSADNQVLDIYIVNSFNQIIQKTFSFTNKSKESGNSTDGAISIKYEQSKLLKKEYGTRTYNLLNNHLGYHHL